jgi:hypothetical protein
MKKILIIFLALALAVTYLINSMADEPEPRPPLYSPISPVAIPSHSVYLPVIRSNHE